MKAAFYGKSKLYCSVACQSGGIKKPQQSAKRPYDAISSNESSASQPQNDAKQSSTSTVSQSQLPLTPITPNAAKVQKVNHVNSTSQLPTPAVTPSTTTIPSTNNLILNSISQVTTVVKSPNTSSAQFSWPYYIEFENENAEAAPVYAFKHVCLLFLNAYMLDSKKLFILLKVPLSEFWNKITNGIKIEVPNRDFSDTEEKYNYWFATVIKYAGYLVKLRYVGFEEYSSKDFWVHLCDPRIQPVGWAAENDVPLIPPANLADKIDDWKAYLVKNLTGFKTLPKNFHRRVCF